MIKTIQESIQTELFIRVKQSAILIHVNEQLTFEDVTPSSFGREAGRRKRHGTGAGVGANKKTGAF